MTPYITSLCSRNESIVGAVEELVGYGFANIELTGGTAYRFFSEEKLLELQRGHRLNYLIHNYFPPWPVEFVLNLASLDDEIRFQTFSHVEQAVAFSVKFGQDLYGLHAGYAYDQIPKPGKGGLFKPMSPPKYDRSSFYAAVDYIAGNKLPDEFRLAIENAFPVSRSDVFSLMASPEDIFHFLDHCRRYPNVGLLLDLGHLNVASHRLGFDKTLFLDRLFSDYADKIFEMHLSSNNGELDTHDISTVSSPEVQVVNDHLSVLRGVPLVLEWHQNLSAYAYEEYLRISELLDIQPASRVANE